MDPTITFLMGLVLGLMIGAVIAGVCCTIYSTRKPMKDGQAFLANTEYLMGMPDDEDRMKYDVVNP